MTESKKLTSTPAFVDPLDSPEGHIWVRLGPGRSTHELMGGSILKTPTEELLAANPEWLRIYLAPLPRRLADHGPVGRPRAGEVRKFMALTCPAWPFSMSPNPWRAPPSEP
jgi:hypothetical protein